MPGSDPGAGRNDTPPQCCRAYTNSPARGQGCDSRCCKGDVPEKEEPGRSVYQKSKSVRVEPGERRAAELPQAARTVRILSRREGRLHACCKATEANTSPGSEPLEPVPRAESAFFPLDGERAVLPGTLAPRQHRPLVPLGSRMPFRHASRALAGLLGVPVSPQTDRGHTDSRSEPSLAGRRL